MKSKQGRTLLAINIWEPNLTKCFVSALDAHFWCVFSSLLIKGVLDLSQRLVYTWSYPRIITLEKVAWINSVGAEYCSRRSYLECQRIWVLCLDCSFLAFSGISCVRSVSLHILGIGRNEEPEYSHAAWHSWGFKTLHSLPKTRAVNQDSVTNRPKPLSVSGGWSALRYACKYPFGVTGKSMR